MTQNNYELPERLETKRLVLRRPVADDTKNVHAYASDPEVTTYVAWPVDQSLEDIQKFVEIVDREWETKTGFAMAINWKDEPNELIGIIHTHIDNHGINYGYALQRPAWGQGVASEALTMLVAHALAHPNIFRAFAFCDAENKASARVMEKAGMTREGLLRRYFIHPNISPEPRDCWMYSRVK